jgi:hypothetical protein
VPLDEYANYTGHVVSVLRRAREPDLELLSPGGELDDAVQLSRTALAESARDELATLLGRLREEQMGMPLDADADRRAAVIFLDWYGWEMEALDAAPGQAALRVYS